MSRHHGRPNLGLETVAGHLNRLPSMEGEQREAWSEAARIAERLIPASDFSLPSGAPQRTLLGPGGPPMPWAIRREIRFSRLARQDFNALARRTATSIRLEVRPAHVAGHLQYEAVVTPLDERGLVTCLFWEFVFGGQGWRQLRRCDQCSTWFVDRSDNQSRRFCTTACSAKWWTRGRRAAMKQTQDSRSRKPS